MFLRRLLAHPKTVGKDLDDPATTELCNQVIFSKPLLKAIYDEWYAILAAELPPGNGPVLELGSGAGYCERYIPGLITSEFLHYPSVKLRLDAQHMPFGNQSLRAIVFTGVLHHIPNVRLFCGSCPLPSAQRKGADDRTMDNDVVAIRLQTFSSRAVLA